MSLIRVETVIYLTHFHFLTNLCRTNNQREEQFYRIVDKALTSGEWDRKRTITDFTSLTREEEAQVNRQETGMKTLPAVLCEKVLRNPVFWGHSMTTRRSKKGMWENRREKMEDHSRSSLDRYLSFPLEFVYRSKGSMSSPRGDCLSNNSYSEGWEQRWESEKIDSHTQKGGETWNEFLPFKESLD